MSDKVLEQFRSGMLKARASERGGMMSLSASLLRAGAADYRTLDDILKNYRSETKTSTRIDKPNRATVCSAVRASLSLWFVERDRTLPASATGSADPRRGLNCADGRRVPHARPSRIGDARKSAATESVSVKLPYSANQVHTHEATPILCVR